MTTNAVFMLGLFLFVLLVLAWPLGLYMSQIFQGQIRGAMKWLRPVENFIYRCCGISSGDEMGRKQYTIALILFNTLGALVVYGLQRLQGGLPLNPQDMGTVSPDSAFNTAISFVTNTNWQGYSGETTMSYLTQMLGLTVQNFLSAATGIAVAVALIRGFARHEFKSIGSFWVDITRATLYVLMPLALVLSLTMVAQGTIQNFEPYQTVQTIDVNEYQQPVLDANGNAVKDANDQPVLETVKTHEQMVAMGPVASQEAIKMLGTNGGGFFNANSAHPYENPTPLTNFLQMLAIFIIPAGLCFTFGAMVGDKRQSWAILAAMSIIFVAMTTIILVSEQNGNPAFTPMGIDQQASALQAGGNMEGKETRFGITASALFAAITTAASCGAVNTMHDALTPLGGLVPAALIQMGEVVFGGVGSGLYGMLIFAILAVFIAGLMIGRTPEYLGKKIEIFEMKMTALTILITPMLVLLGTAVAIAVDAGRAGILNPAAHGFTEVLYAFSSAANNNGSAFAGLSANTVFYNTMLGIAMWFGRFAMIVPILAIAGSLASKKRLAVNSGTMPTHGPLFVVLLIGTVLLVGALNYIPALSLGPVIEHLQMQATQP